MDRKRQLCFFRRNGETSAATREKDALSRALGEAWEVVGAHAARTVDGVRLGGHQGSTAARARQFARSAHALVKREAFDAVLSQEPGAPGAIYQARAGVLRKWLPMRYGSGLASVLNHWYRLAPRLEHQSLEHARVIVAPSEMVFGDIQECYPEFAEKVRVVYSGYSPELCYPPEVPRVQLRKSLGLPSAPLVLFHGNDWARQGLDAALRFMAQACKIIREEASRPQMLVVGHGRASDYNSLLRKLGIRERVQFIAEPPDPESLYRAAHVLVMPTQYDALSQACLQALACGCPVVTTANNGAAELIRHEETGFLLDAVGIEPLRNAASWWLRLRAVPAQIAQSVAPLSEDAAAGKLANIVREVAG